MAVIINSYRRKLTNKLAGYIFYVDNGHDLLFRTKAQFPIAID